MKIFEKFSAAGLVEEAALGSVFFLNRDVHILDGELE